MAQPPRVRLARGPAGRLLRLDGGWGGGRLPRRPHRGPAVRCRCLRWSLADAAGGGVQGALGAQPGVGRGWRGARDSASPAPPPPNADPARWAGQAEVSSCCLIKSGRTLVPPAVPCSLSSSALGMGGGQTRGSVSAGNPVRSGPGWEEGLPLSAPVPPPGFTVAPGVPPARCPHRVTPKDGTRVPPAPRCGDPPGDARYRAVSFSCLAGREGCPGMPVARGDTREPSRGPLPPELPSGAGAQARSRVRGAAWGPSSTPGGAVGEGRAMARHACASRLSSRGSRGTGSFRASSPPAGGERYATPNALTPFPKPQGHSVRGAVPRHRRRPGMIRSPSARPLPAWSPGTDTAAG